MWDWFGFFSVVYTNSFHDFFLKFQPTVCTFIFICLYKKEKLPSAKLNKLYCTYVLPLLLLVVIFPLRGDFCWHVQDISRVQIFFPKVAVFSIIICGEMSQGLLGFYIKRIKIRVFLDFFVIVFRGTYTPYLVVSCWIRSMFIFFILNFFWCYNRSMEPKQIQHKNK